MRSKMATMSMACFFAVLLVAAAGDMALAPACFAASDDRLPSSNLASEYWIELTIFYIPLTKSTDSPCRTRADVMQNSVYRVEVKRKTLEYKDLLQKIDGLELKVVDDFDADSLDLRIWGQFTLDYYNLIMEFGLLGVADGRRVMVIDNFIVEEAPEFYELVSFFVPVTEIEDFDLAMQKLGYRQRDSRGGGRPPPRDSSELIWCEIRTD